MSEMDEIPELTLMPVDDVAWQNDMYMAQGQQVCVGYDGAVRPFEIPLSVRKGWAKSGQKNPYTNRVEAELIDREAARQMQREWAEAILAESDGENSLAAAMAHGILSAKPPWWRRWLRAAGLGV